MVAQNQKTSIRNRDSMCTIATRVRYPSGYMLNPKYNREFKHDIESAVQGLFRTNVYLDRFEYEFYVGSHNETILTIMAHCFPNRRVYQHLFIAEGTIYAHLQHLLSELFEGQCIAIDELDIKHFLLHQEYGM